MSDNERLHDTWLTSTRAVPSRFVRPLLQFTHIEAAGGVVLLVAAIAALLWANLGFFGDSYDHFWETHLHITIGNFEFDESFKHIVNDALMAIFFFVVGLEIKRELVVGELNDPRRAALPAIAALGGMIVPAAIYVAFNAGTEAVNGWGIPMATDIAFSVGVLSLLGRRVSVGAKLFLLALAIADDIGAIAVIAIFYTSDLATGWLLAAIGGLAVVAFSSRIGIRAQSYYWVIGAVVWFFVFESGVHATLAGVALGFLTPVRAWYSDNDYYKRSTWILTQFDMDNASPDRRAKVDQHALALSSIARESVSPLDRLERQLHPWSSFVIVPLFALANAGVRFTDIDVVEAATSAVSLGVALGLIVGKTVGIAVFTWLAVRLGLGKLPKRTGWQQIFGLAALAGIGFTVSLFITELAFQEGADVAILTDRAKIGIFIGSTVAGVLGWWLLKRGSQTPPPVGPSDTPVGAAVEPIQEDDPVGAPAD
ncbi:MAG: Na+/H+ antiporter NhaA [Acidimicrobiia bacterium]|nr:Na+/H+ antiporter NhaA [Acidimicrobiia bacterium]